MLNIERQTLVIGMNSMVAWSGWNACMPWLAEVRSYERYQATA